MYFPLLCKLLLRSFYEHDSVQNLALPSSWHDANTAMLSFAVLLTAFTPSSL